MNRSDMAQEIWQQIDKEVQLKQVDQILTVLFSNIDECLKMGGTFTVKNFGRFYLNPSKRKRLQPPRKDNAKKL